jgi:hypothetical protein
MLWLRRVSPIWAPALQRTAIPTLRLAIRRMLLSDENGEVFPLCRYTTTANLKRSTLSSSEKKNYITAVQCLSKKPGKTPAALAAGVKNRYDDFVATHINQTLSIHGTVCIFPTSATTLLINLRETSCRGIGTSPGSTSRHFATSAATLDTSRIITGRAGPIVQRLLPCLTALVLPCLETELMWLDATTPAFLLTMHAALDFPPATEEAASSQAHLRSKSILEHSLASML